MKFSKAIVPFMLGLLACSEAEIGTAADDLFFLRSEGATMPVFIRGNTLSNVFIVYLHGGPGFTSLEGYQKAESPFTKLQEDYAMVYWEQRCAGSSQGGCDFDNLHLDQYTEDLEKLMRLLRDRYDPGISVFLFGHSWGGSLGIQYLAKEDNQGAIRGWIEADGGHNVPRIAQLEREMILRVGQRQIAQGNKPEEWEKNIREANELDLSKTDDVFEMNRIARRSESLMANVDSVTEPIETFSLADYFFSPVDIHAAIGNGERTIDALKEEIVNLDLSAKTRQITLPTLLLWGKYDFRVPPTFATEAFQNYGSVNKELIWFERSAHFIYWNEPEKFRTIVSNFIERHR